ncbi:MAG: ComF family protein [Patescibacteria group bacterium]
MFRPLGLLRSFLLAWLFPAACYGCGREDAALCSDCFRRLRFYKTPRSAEQTALIAAPALSGLFIAGDYEDPLLSRLIKKFKYNFLTELAKPLGRFLTLFWQGRLALAENSVQGRNLWETVVLAPVPLAKRRLHWRGSNQAELLARELGAAFGYPLLAGLRRIKHTEVQAKLKGRERQQNLRGAFVWTGAPLAGQTIILIDDVVTTGATLNEAASALQAGGAGKIYGLVLAKG